MTKKEKINYIKLYSLNKRRYDAVKPSVERSLHYLQMEKDQREKSIKAQTDSFAGIELNKYQKHLRIMDEMIYGIDQAITDAQKIGDQHEVDVLIRNRKDLARERMNVAHEYTMSIDIDKEKEEEKTDKKMLNEKEPEEGEEADPTADPKLSEEEKKKLEEKKKKLEKE